MVIKPNVEYTIFIEFTSSRNYYNVNVYKQRIEIQKGVIIDFHKFNWAHENSVEHGIITGMKFHAKYKECTSYYSNYSRSVAAELIRFYKGKKFIRNLYVCTTHNLNIQKLNETFYCQSNWCFDV